MKWIGLGMITSGLMLALGGTVFADDVIGTGGTGKPAPGFCGDIRSNYAVQMIEDIQALQDPSYVLLSTHYGAGAAFGADVTSKNILFEGQLSHPFQIFDLSCISRWTGHAVEGFLTFNPKIVLRMYRGTSVPVRTPSYMPDLTWYAWAPNREENPGNWFTSLRVGHHSNGQSGPFMQGGVVNTVDGNFSTNYWRLGINFIQHDPRLIWSGELAFTSHFGSAQGFFSREPGLEGQYEKQKLTLGIKASNWNPATAYIDSMSGRVTVDYVIRGKDYVIRPTVPATFGDKWNISSELMIKPSFFEEVYIFAKYDYGYDYYNIHFQERINRLMLGIGGIIGGH